MDAVEEIKSRIGIDEVVGRYVDLRRSGASYKGLCPFHQEKTPSFYVTPGRGTYHCFGCGKGGDIFQFLMEVERLTFPEALQRLADQAGVRLEERDEQKPSLKKQLYAANEAALAFFRQCLQENRGTRARSYLEERHFDRQAIELFELGYAPDEREALIQHLRKQGIDERIMLSAGLAVQPEEGEALRARFRGRLMFPIRDQSGRIRGFGGRTLGDAQPKYLNSPQTEIFDKSSVLYGIHLAADAVRKAGRSVLVEGYLDAVRAHRADFPWTVASLGTAVTVPQLTALSRLADTVVIALDPDPAGQSAAARAAITALAEVTRTAGRMSGGSRSVDLRVARLPAGLGDPDELIRDHPDQWVRLIDEAVPAFDFFFERTIASLDRSSDGWVQTAIDTLLPLIQQFATSAGWQAQQIERLAKATGIDPRVLLGTLPAQPRRSGRRPEQRPSEAPPNIVSATTSRALAANPLVTVEQELLALLLKMVVVPRDAAELLAGWAPERPEHTALREALLAWADGGGYDYEMLRETIPEDARAYADELQARDVQLPDEGRISTAVAMYLTRLRRFRLQAELGRMRDALAGMDAESGPQAIEALQRVTGEQHEVDMLLDQLSKSLLRAAGGGPDQGTMLQDSGRL